MFNSIIKSVLFFLFFMSTNINAQSVPTPGDVQEKPIYILGGTYHLGNGEVIENGVLSFEDGKITLVGENQDPKFDKEAVNTIDAKGKHIYPGFITPNSLNGLVEINAVRPTRDYREVGRFKPNVRSIIAYNTDSWITPTVRSNGVLIAQIRPESGRIPGTSAIVQLDAWNYEDAAIKQDDGIFLNWPRTISRGGWWAQPGEIKKNKEYQKEMEEVSAFFTEARSYCQGNEAFAETNLKFEAMCDCFGKGKKVYIAAYEGKAIVDAVEFSKKTDIDMVLVGGYDSWMVAEVLKENNIPVILAKTHRLPFRASDDIDLPFKLPTLLKEAGIEFCMSAENSSGEQRNLPFTIGKSIAYGLSKEDAVMAITGSAAKILGIDDRMGTLEVGKDATLIISTGDALDVRGNNIEHAFIQGRTLDLGNKQIDLYEKFMGKYKLETK